MRSENARIDYALLTVTDRRYIAQFEIKPIEEKDRVATMTRIMDNLLDYHVVSHLS